MGWFSRNTQVQQNSHQQVSPQDRVVGENESDINHTLDQIVGDRNKLDMTVQQKQSEEESNEQVTKFVNNRPNNMFVIDGERDAQQSIICTNNETGGKNCLKLQYNSIQLFKQMQKLEYFCSLPEDINATYFECRKIK